MRRDSEVRGGARRRRPGRWLPGLGLLLAMPCLFACSDGADEPGVQPPPAPPAAPSSNVSLVRVRGPSRVVGGRPLVLTLDLRLTDVPAESLRLEVERLDAPDAASGTFLQPELLGLEEKADGLQQVRLACPPGEQGVHTFRVHARIDGGDADPLDDAALHAVHVGPPSDGLIRVLYLDGTARWEQQYLSNALTRDVDRVRAHTLLVDADADTPQRSTSAPDWEPLDLERAELAGGKGLARYDVIVMGDADWRDFFSRTEEGAAGFVTELARLVRAGSGLLVVAGPRHMPTKYAGTALHELLPVVLDPAAEEADPRLEGDDAGFGLRLTVAGRFDRSMNVADGRIDSRELWEKHAQWRQFWSYPALRAREDASVLAVSPLTEHENEFGPRPLVAYRRAGAGTVFYVGVDELWRTRSEVGDRYFYAFYGDVVHRLASSRMFGSADLRTLFPERSRFAVGSPVTVWLTLGPWDSPGQAASARVRALGDDRAWSVAFDLHDAQPRQRLMWTPESPGTYEVTLDTDPPLSTRFDVVE